MRALEGRACLVRPRGRTTQTVSQKLSDRWPLVTGIGVPFVRSFTSPAFGTMIVAVPQITRQIATIAFLTTEFTAPDFSQSRAARQSDSSSWSRPALGPVRRGFHAKA